MAFNINNFLNTESKKEINNDWKPVKISIHKLKPAPGNTNFYHAEEKEIRELAESIELVGLQQYPVVRPIEGTDEYEVLAGHKRRLALLRLVEEGKTGYEMVPCRIEKPDAIQNELILIFTNSTQRERTDYEKMREIERVRELLKEYEKTHELTGRRQSIIAGILGTSKTKVGTLDNINKNLIEPFKDEFAAGKINTSTANEIAGLMPDAQQALHETYEQTGALTAREAKLLKSPSLPEEQPEEKAMPDAPGTDEKEEAEDTAERREGQQEQQNEEEVEESTPEPENGQQEPQNVSESGVENESARNDNDCKTGMEESRKKLMAKQTLEELILYSAYLKDNEVRILEKFILLCKGRARR